MEGTVSIKITILKELYTDMLRRQMHRAFTCNLEGHVQIFGSEIGYYDTNISWFSSGPPVIPQIRA
jgi:hypothetical protein